jgi:glycosyltransferase involved in cell wall biosynthesis
MRILMLPKYGLLAASSRQRFHAYIPYLERAGIEVEVSELFSNCYLERYFEQGSRSIGEVQLGYRRRLNVLSRAGQFDCVMIHFECLPYLSGFSERRLLSQDVPYVLDFDDAIHHQYADHPRALVRWLLGKKIRRIAHGASAVLAGNEYLANFASDAGCRRVVLLPTVIDHVRYAQQSESQQAHHDATTTIGWMGSRSTAGYLDEVRPVIERLADKYRVRMLVVGAGKPNTSTTLIEHRPWREDSEIADLAEMDIGIMPLPDTPWERGKCGYKLIQYMGVSRPVVASPVGVNVQIVQHGVNGFMADGKTQWMQFLRTLIEQPELREKMGRAGRAKVEREYSLDVNAPALIDLIREVVAER